MTNAEYYRDLVAVLTAYRTLCQTCSEPWIWISKLLDETQRRQEAGEPAKLPTPTQAISAWLTAASDPAADVVNRVAQEMHKTVCGNLVDYTWEDYRELAQAALAVMSKPASDIEASARELGQMAGRAAANEVIAWMARPVVVDEAFALHLVDVVWQEVTESEAVPSTVWAKRLSAKARGEMPDPRAALEVKP